MWSILSLLPHIDGIDGRIVLGGHALVLGHRHALLELCTICQQGGHVLGGLEPSQATPSQAESSPVQFILGQVRSGQVTSSQ